MDLCPLDEVESVIFLFLDARFQPKKKTPERASMPRAFRAQQPMSIGCVGLGSRMAMVR